MNLDVELPKITMCMPCMPCWICRTMDLPAVPKEWYDKQLVKYEVDI